MSSLQTAVAAALSTGISAAIPVDPALTPDEQAALAAGQSGLATAVALATPLIMPPGVILPYGGGSAPAGFLLCDGSSYPIATYPTLFAAIGYSFGGDGVSNFNTPDLRGQFVRGLDSSGANVDPDVASRTALKSGGNTGAKVGSAQTDNIKAHNHVTPFVDPASGSTMQIAVVPGVNPGGTTNISQNNNYGGNTPYAGGINAAGAAAGLTNFGGNETRAKNVAVNFIIAT